MHTAERATCDVSSSCAPPSTGKTRRPRDQPLRPARSSFLSPSPSMHCADADSERVQASSSHHESHAVEQRALAGRKFGSVRVAVEDREEPDQRRRRHASGGRTSNITAAPSRIAERAMPYSIPGKRHAHQPQHSAESHHHGKRHRQQPNRRRAELRAPQADRDHRQHVIKSRDRDGGSQ